MPARSSVTPASRARLRATSGSAKRRQRERQPMTSAASTKSFQRVGPSSRTVQVDGTPVDLADGDPNDNFPPKADTGRVMHYPASRLPDPRPRFISAATSAPLVK